MWSVDTLSDPIWQRLTWTLAHFLWQGLLIAVVLQAAQWLLGTRRPQTRYTLCLLAMLTMAACPPVTFALLGNDAPMVVSEAVPFSSAPQQAVEPIALPADLQPAIITTTSPAKGPLATPLPPHEPRLADYVRSTQPYLLVGWLGGVCLLSLRLLLGMVGVQRLRFSRMAVPETLIASANRIGSRLALRSIPRVFASDKVREAVAVGLVRPIVLLPLSWLTEMPPEVLEAVLAHELAHIRRWDLWVNMFQRLMETFLFYHPAVWWLSRRIRQEREMCCDELAVAATGNRTTYATALETVARRRLSHIEPTLASAIGGSKTALLDRVRNILGISSTNGRARWWPAGAISLLALLTIWLVSTTVAQQREPQENPASVGHPPATNEDSGSKGSHLSISEAQEATVAGHDAKKAEGIRPLDVLRIQATGTPVEFPIDDLFLVEPSGQIALGPLYGRLEVKTLTIEAAEQRIQKHLRRVLTAPMIQVVAAGRVTKWRRALLPESPYHIRARDALSIHVIGTLADQPIEGIYHVEPSGRVPLGPAYGRVSVAGLMLGSAENAIEQHLKQLLADPVASVAFAHWDTMEHDVRTLKAPYRIGPGDLLDVHVAGTIQEHSIQGTHLVEPSGQVLLGPFYGRVELKGLTLEEAEAATKEHLLGVLAAPEISITLGGWKDEGGVFKEASGNVLMKQQWTNIVYVMGSVAAPGAYELPRGASSLLNALVAAGGLSEEAGTFVEIRSIRDGKPKLVRLNLADQREPAKGAHALRDGDTVSVERREPKPQPSDLAHLRHTARLLAEQAMIVEHWEKLGSNGYRQMIQEVGKGFVKQTYEAHFILPEARDEKQRPEDQFEKDVLKRFPTHKPGETTGSQRPDYTERVLSETNQYQYYQPIYAESGVCVTCHNALGRELTPLKERDLMAVIRLTLPWPQTTEQ